MCTMSVSWHNQRYRQLLAAHGNIEIECFTKFHLKEQTDGELRIFTGVAFQNCGTT